MKRLLFLLIVALTVGLMAGAANAAWQEYLEDFEVGFAGSAIENHADWFCVGGTVPTAGVGLNGSVGLPPDGQIMSWEAHAFSWANDLAVGDVVIMGMDFEGSSTGAATSILDDDRLGWMRTQTVVSDDIFAVQCDPGGGGTNIECYWENGGGNNRSTIVDTSLVAGTWYRFRATFTKLTDTSCSIDVSLVDLDGSGNPIPATEVTGRVDDSSLSVPLYSLNYFTDPTQWPAYKNYNENGNADNAYFAIGTPVTSAATDPIPEDNGFALTTLQFLEWLRPEPLNEGDTILVNVYLGSVDPNLIPGKHGTQLVVENYDGDSTDQFAKPLTLNKIYYWRVDCIDPNGGLGDVITKGNTWTFTTTVSPEVIVTESDGSTEVSEEGETSDTYTISLSKSPASPVTVTIGPPPVFVPIAASGDDAEENQGSGSISRSSSDLEMPYDGSTLQIIGLYFKNIQIPRYATITSASVEFKSDSNEPDDVWLTIWGRLDDPGSFQQDIDWMISTPTIADDETSATVEWTMVDPVDEWLDDGAYLTPDLRTIIQEIVDQSTWDAGNNLAICIGNGNGQGTTASGDKRRAESWNGTSYGGPGIKQPILRVEYTMGQITWDPPVVVLDGTNWEGVDVTVRAVDDSLVESDPHTVTLANVVTSASADWDALPADDVVVSIIENDCGSWGFALGDLNKDCVVDLGDLAEFASQFGRCTDPHFPAICNDIR